MDRDILNQINLKLKINLRDSFFSINEKPAIIHFRNGKPVISRGDHEVEIYLDVSDFSSLLMGVIPFRKLFEYGLVEVSDKGYLELLDKLFKSDFKPWCMTAF